MCLWRPSCIPIDEARGIVDGLIWDPDTGTDEGNSLEFH
jgi:hypothetical protein